MIKWLKYNDIFPLAVFLIYVLSIVFVPLAFAGGGDFPEQNMAVQKTIEVTTHVPEDDWKDYLEWIVPGVITPIVLFYAGYKINKRRK